MTDLVQNLAGALEETLLFCETFSNRWDGQTGAHPFGMVERARAALSEAKAGGWVAVPVQVLQDASEALDNFVSDHGWGDSDMQAMDNLDAYIATHKARTAPPAQRGEG